MRTFGSEPRAHALGSEAWRTQGRAPHAPHGTHPHSSERALHAHTPSDPHGATHAHTAAPPPPLHLLLGEPVAGPEMDSGSSDDGSSESAVGEETDTEGETQHARPPCSPQPSLHAAILSTLTGTVTEDMRTLFPRRAATVAPAATAKATAVDEQRRQAEHRALATDAFVRYARLPADAIAWAVTAAADAFPDVVPLHEIEAAGDEAYHRARELVEELSAAELAEVVDAQSALPHIAETGAGVEAEQPSSLTPW